MSAVAATDIARNHEPWTREFWLCHCEGYRVETSDGFVGFVEKVFRASGASEPEALDVRTGLDGRGLVTVPIGLVREIRPEAERIVL